MRKILFLLLFLLCATFVNAQKTYKFGNIVMKDTASGSIDLKSGGLYTSFMYTTGNITINGDSGIDFILSGQGNGLYMHMLNPVADFYSDGIQTFVPFYLPQYSNSEISELIVGNGAMVINSDTQEVWVYLDNQWQILDTK